MIQDDEKGSRVHRVVLLVVGCCGEISGATSGSYKHSSRYLDMRVGST